MTIRNPDPPFTGTGAPLAGGAVRFALAVLAVVAALTPLQAQPAITADRFQLDNGLTVVVHEDRKTPVVSVMMLYRVGSKDEPAGLYGFAHLFEHLMLTGSANRDESALRTYRDIGATDFNATATRDATLFYQTVPRGALEAVLFVEADRMANLLGALTEEKLQNQIEVVLSEMRLAEDRPYGVIGEGVFEDMYPAGHPYRHPTVGNEADLRAATLEDARAWFERYYGAANAVLVLSGDIDRTTAERLAKKYFGGIEAGPPIERASALPVYLDEDLRRRAEVRAAQPRLMRHYLMPPAGRADTAYADLIAQIVANGRASLLHRLLVDRLDLATSVSVSYGEDTLSSQIGLIVTAEPGTDMSAIERALDAELARFAQEGPSPEQLASAKRARENALLQFLETVFGQSLVLARGELLAGDANFFPGLYLETLREAQPADVAAKARRIFGAGSHTTEVVPFTATDGHADGYDLSLGMPDIEQTPAPSFAALDTALLDNGLEIVTLDRPSTNFVEIVLQVDAPAPAGDEVRRAAVSLLGETAADHGQTLSTAIGDLGGGIDFASGAEGVRITLSLPDDAVEPALRLLGEAIADPGYGTDALATYRERRRSELVAGRTNTYGIAEIALGQALFGGPHPYALAPTDERLAESANLTPERLSDWYRRWFRPAAASLFAVGRLTELDMSALARRTLGDWTGGPATARPAMETPAQVRGDGRIILLDRPGMQQAYISAGRLLPPSGAAGDTAQLAMNEVFGGNFTARINTNLRERRGWSYGIGSGIANARGPRIFRIAGTVDADRAAASVRELFAEMRGLTGDDPASREELRRVQQRETMALAGALEQNRDIAIALADSRRYGRPLDWRLGEGERFAAVTLPQVQAAAADLLDPREFIWIVVGDLSQIANQFEEDFGIPVVRSGSAGKRRSGQSTSS